MIQEHTICIPYVQRQWKSYFCLKWQNWIAHFTCCGHAVVMLWSYCGHAVVMLWSTKLVACSHNAAHTIWFLTHGEKFWAKLELAQIKLVLSAGFPNVVVSWWKNKMADFSYVASRAGNFGYFHSRDFFWVESRILVLLMQSKMPEIKNSSLRMTM